MVVTFPVAALSFLRHSSFLPPSLLSPSPVTARLFQSLFGHSSRYSVVPFATLSFPRHYSSVPVVVCTFQSLLGRSNRCSPIPVAILQRKLALDKDKDSLYVIEEINKDESATQPT